MWATRFPAVSVAVYSCTAYSLVKFLLYPALVLPTDTAKQVAFTIFSTEVSLQDGLVLAYNCGMAAGKFPAVLVISSKFFYNHRFAVLCALTSATGCFVALPMACLPSMPALHVAGMFLAAIPNSWIFGCVVSYLEGREATELLIAALTFSLVVSAAAAKSLANLVLQLGVSATTMPLVLGGCSLPLCVAVLFLLDQAPDPTAQDRAARNTRQAMDSEERSAFIHAHRYLIGLLLVAYCLAGVLRSYRDQFSRPIFTEALGHAPSSTFFLLADIPGSIACCGLLLGLNRISLHKQGLLALLGCMTLGSLLAVLNSVVHEVGDLLGGTAWQIIASIAIYTAYQNTPVYERLVALSESKGTCTFLIFISDMAVYIGTSALVLWKVFFTQEKDTAQYDEIALGTMAPSVLFLTIAGLIVFRYYEESEISALATVGSCSDGELPYQFLASGATQ